MINQEIYFSVFKFLTMPKGMSLSTKGRAEQQTTRKGLEPETNMGNKGARDKGV